jgi:hypothetical protein
LRAKDTTSRAVSEDAEALIKEGERHDEKMLEIQRQVTEHRLLVTQASVQQIIDAERSLADREFQIKQAALDHELSALSAFTAGYREKVQAIKDQKAELAAEHAFESTQVPKGAIQAIVESEQEKIKATHEGESERLDVINAALHEEEAYGLQGTAFYRSLLQERVNTIRQIAEEEDKLQAEAGKIAAEHEFKMGELQIAAQKEASQNIMTRITQTAADRIALEMSLENQSFQIEKAAINDKLTSLDASDREYLNKVQQLYNQLEELEKQHNNKMLAIQNQADATEYKNLTDAQHKVLEGYSRGFGQVIIGKESFLHLMQQMDSQLVGNMLQHVLMSMATLDFGKEKQASKAARDAYLSAMDGIPAPANFFIAPAWAAISYAAVMGAQEGADMVPGVGRGDIVPYMLEPGEGVVPGGVMDKLRGLADRGGLDAGGGGTHIHVHFRPTYHVSAIDGASVRGMLEKHADEFTNHVTHTLRKMNR